MRKKYLGISAALLGMTLTGAVGVYAGSNLQPIKAYLNYGLSVEVNGSVLKDGQGKAASPITYRDVTYLPVRAVAEGLGASVDLKQGKVLIQSKSPSTSISPSTSSPSQSSSTKPTYLPSDFKIPGDAKYTASNQGITLGKKYVIVEFITKESFESLYEDYRNYLKNHDFGDFIESKEDGEFSFNAKNSKQSFIISGTLNKDKEPLTEITINWSE